MTWPRRSSCLPGRLLAAEARRLLGPSARVLAAGASCTVYTDGWRALRLATGTGTQLQVQAALMQRLAAAGVPTPRVLDTGFLQDGRAYSLETLVGGDAGGPSRQGWADLGRALGALHRLPHTGFGLLIPSAAGFQGAAPNAADGLRTRLDTWPLGTRGLRQQPLIQQAPTLSAPLAALEPELWRVAGGRPLSGHTTSDHNVAGHPSLGHTVVCHTDLHGGQLRWRRGRLCALLDFGDAAVGPPAWDIASVAFFHGWPVAGQVAQAAHLPCGRDITLFGLLLAFHRANRAAQQGTPGRLERASAFAHSCLERL